MAERFEKLYSLPNNLFSEQAPVIISAGSLLKDTQSGKVVAQMKFRSVCSKTIKALMISMAAYDVAGKNLDGVEEYQYLDLNIHNSQEFGSNKAVVLPSNVTRSFSIRSIVVVFGDDTTWQSSEPFTALPTPKTIENTLKDLELQKQYRLAINDDAAYCPVEEQGIWQCACGVWNGATTCSNCGAAKNEVFDLFNIDMLSKEADKRLQLEREAQAAKAEQERIVAEEKAKYLAERTAKNKAIIKKVKVISAIVLPIVALVLLFALWIYPGIIQPNMAYNAALQMLDSAQYEEARDAFTALGNYKDAATMVKECSYRLAEMLLSQGDLSGALKIYEELGEYKDSAEKNVTVNNAVDENKYQKAIALLAEEKWAEAYSLFNQLKDYKESSKYLSNFKWYLSKERGDNNTILYNQLGQIVQETNKFGATTSYIYDASGNLSEEKYSGSSSYVQTYTYDASRLLVSSRYQESDGTVSNYTYSYEFDESGNIETKTVHKNGELLTSYYYTYNSNNEIVREVQEDADGYSQTYNYKYDSSGNVIWDQFCGIATTNTYTYQYDANNRLIQRTQTEQKNSSISKKETKWMYTYQFNDDGMPTSCKEECSEYSA